MKVSENVYKCTGCGKTYAAIIGGRGHIPKPDELCYVCKEPKRVVYAEAIQVWFKRIGI